MEGKLKTEARCALCLETKELVESHVISKLFWRRIYGKDRTAVELSGDLANPRSIQMKGHKEQMLCLECDQQFGKYETYVGNLWDKSFPRVREGTEFIMEGLDYKRFKLFLLSVLWRASVARHEFFRAVSLGPFEEIVRRMLREENPGLPDSFAVFPVIQHSENVIIDTIVQPFRDRVGAFTFYRFIFGGVVWHFIVSKKSAYEFINFPFFSEAGVLRFGTEDIIQSSAVKSLSKSASKL